MSSRQDTHTPAGDELRETLRANINRGWTLARITHEMNLLGHKGWTTSVVAGALKDRQFTIDEAISLYAILRGNAKAIVREIDRQEQKILKAAES